MHAASAPGQTQCGACRRRVDALAWTRAAPSHGCHAGAAQCSPPRPAKQLSCNPGAGKDQERLRCGGQSAAWSRSNAAAQLPGCRDKLAMLMPAGQRCCPRSAGSHAYCQGHQMIPVRRCMPTCSLSAGAKSLPLPTHRPITHKQQGLSIHQAAAPALLLHCHGQDRVAQSTEV